MNRIDLANAIHERLGGSISHRKIYQAVGIIIEQITSDLVNDQVVTVRRFGTLSPYVRMAHLANNVRTGMIRKLRSVKSIKFHPHEAFTSLIHDRQERFRQKDDDNS
jgi:nucleoid DNA-binding protein